MQKPGKHINSQKSDMFLDKYLKEEEEAILFQQVVVALHL